MAETIGRRLTALRDRAGLSLAEVARLAGYRGPSSVQAYFDASYDIRPLRATIALRLADAMVGKGDPPIRQEELFEMAQITRGDLERAADFMPYVPATPTLRGQPKDIPIFTSALAADMEFDASGSGKEAVEMTVFSMNEVVAHVRRPPGLNDAGRYTRC